MVEGATPRTPDGPAPAGRPARWRWDHEAFTKRSATMRPVRHITGTLALTLTLAVAALLLPSSPARAGQGHGGGRAGWGGPGPSGHHGHHPHPGGYGWT